MPETSIPVDLFNPGQVFACLGFMELGEVLVGSLRARFVWSDDGSNARFELETTTGVDPFDEALGFLSEARVRLLIPPGADLSGEKWKLDEELASPDVGFPLPTPASPASLPAVLEARSHRFVIDAWGDATRRDNVKFWAGAGGYPGAALVRDALELTGGRCLDARLAPFALSGPQSSSLRFDWRRDYVPLAAGFSLNEHDITPLGYPLVELLAAIGLAHARPLRPRRGNKLHYRYAVLGGEFLRPAFHRAALGCAPLPFSTRSFSVALDWPGKANQARCITSVTEEPRT